MNKVHLLMMAGGLFSLKGMAQTDSSRQEETSADTVIVSADTVIKSNENCWTEKSTNAPYRSRWKNRVSTNWFVVDLGFANYSDRTHYDSPEAQSFVHDPASSHPASAGDFSIKTGSYNFNLWLFMQRMNLYKRVINLKYGAGIELYKYYYKSGIRYIDGTDPYVERQPTAFKKNKFAFDYVTVPMMLNINPGQGHKNGGLNLSAGISVSYLYGARNKQKSDELGKQKFSGDFNLERWKLAYVAELGLGPVRLYGSRAITPLHQYGVDQYPYAVGIRLSSW